MSSKPAALQRLFLFLVLFFPTLITASVLAIDYGTDFTKVSLMKPGMPFDVILNRDSKRKIASSVAWKGEERLFGADATNIAPRFPSVSFPSLKYLQGAAYSSAPSQFHALIHPYLKVSEVPERNTHSFTRKEGESWTNEELVAMQFGYIKDLAESVSGARVRDAVVTVPAYYTQYERQAVLDSLALAGLRAVSLVHDGTAIAVNFAISRGFPTLEHHIIYDAGASGIRATLVSFQTIAEPVSPKSKKTVDVTHVTVQGFGYDRVASAIKAAFGEGKIAHKVNADEAAVLGAAFYGASQSRQFKTKEVKVQDRVLNGLDIEVSYLAESKTGGQRTIHTSVLPSTSSYGAKKVLTFKRKEDFSFILGYKEGDSLHVPPQILEAEISGVAEALANLTSRGAIDPLVKVTIGMLSDFGMAIIHDASVYGEVKEETIVGKIKNLFGGSSSSSSSATGDTETATTSDSTETASAEEPLTTEVKSVPSTIPLEVSLRYLSILPYSGEEIGESRQRLVAVDAAEKLRHKKEEARNMLEGYLYRLRDLLDGDETSPFMLFSKPEEREKLEAKLSENFRWINEGADEAEIKELWSRRDDMEVIEKPIQFRYEEDKAA
ncbi:lumenal Hsp70 protein, partial [Serendipita sp. 401]